MPHAAISVAEPVPFWSRLMDWTGWYTAAGILAGIAMIVAKNWSDIRNLRAKHKVLYDEHKVIWHGIVQRGYLEAELLGLTYRTGNPEKPWAVSDRAKIVYAPICPTLKATHEALAKKLGHEPSEDTLAFAFEAELQQWMLENACPRLNLKHHGCLAIACILAKNGT